ncbi:MAG: hypothetical protein ACU0DI_06565 [Paracoccaceae bacterium]
MFESLKSALRIVFCHRSLYAGLALAYIIGTTGLDENTVKHLIAGLYFLLMLRG